MQRAFVTRTGTSGLRGSALFIVEDLSVPLNRRVWQECVSIRDAGLEVTVVCPRGRTHDTEAFELLDGIAIHRYPLTQATGGILSYVREYAAAMWHTARLVRGLTRRCRFDVVHACNPPDLLLLTVWHLKRSGTRLIFDQHDLVPELYLSRFGRKPDLLHRVTLALERLTYRIADVVISTNESYRRVALARGSKSDDDVFVVRSAPDLTRFVRTPAAPELKRGKRFLLAYVGVMGPQDGVDHALRALAELRRRRTDWHAIFVGDGDVAADMRRLTTELGLDDVVQFTGRVPDDELLTTLSTADVCLAPDPRNPLNDVSTMNKIVEYMAVSRPIVSYDLKEARASAGDAALYATPNNPVAFADCVDRLLDDPSRRERMGSAGHERLRLELSWQHSEQALLAAYERALDGPRRSSRAAIHD